MRLTIDSMDFKQFMGISELNIDLSPRTDIRGMNGTGKSTIATGFYWLFCDKNYALRSNPPVYPLDAEEATPTVTATGHIDDRPFKITKKQTRKVTPQSDGTKKVSLSNSYEINDVPKSERDVQKFFDENGIPVRLFLPLSHPEVFTSQKSQDMRKVLFAMATDKSDEEIANETDGCVDVAKLLGSYSVDEITAMQKATMRKINENYGKSGEILNAKIEGLVLARNLVEYDEKKLSDRKWELEEELTEISKTTVVDTKKARLQSLLAESKNKLKQIEQDVSSSYNDHKFDLQNQLSNAQHEYDRAKSDQKFIDDSYADSKRRLENFSKTFEKFKDEYEKEKKVTFDAKGGVCPTCGQKLPEDQLKKQIDTWNTTHNETLHDINTKAASVNKFIKAEQKKLDDLAEQSKEQQKKVYGLSVQVDELKNKIDSIPSFDFVLRENRNYINESNNFNDLSIQLSELSDDSDIDNSEDIKKINAEIDSINKKLAENENNKRIEEQIAQLRKDQENYEQQRADAEKILYELDLLSKAKNEQLANSINSHFELVKFRLFTWQKNGGYVEDCTPMIGDKTLNDSMNNALATLAKIDIINGLQKFYGVSLPVFIDNAESLDSSSKQEINIDSQLIFLSVSEGKGLIFLP